MLAAKSINPLGSGGKWASELLWINKNSKSDHLSQSSAGEKTLINRYVQTGRKRKRKSKAPHAERDAASSERHTDSNAEMKASGSATQNCVNPSTIVSHAMQGAPAVDPECPALEVMVEPRVSQIAWKRRVIEASGAQQIRRGVSSAMDPFETGSVRIDTTERSLLHYYVNFYHPTIWPNELAAQRKGLYAFRSAVEHIMCMAWADELAMCSLLSAASSRFRFIDRLPSPPPLEKEYCYLDRALNLLRMRINENTKDEKKVKELLQHVMFLASAEAYRDNVKAAQIHLKAAVKLLASRGGIMQVEDQCLQGQLLMTDLYLACINVVPCIFQCDYDPGPANTLLLEEWELTPSENGNIGTALLTKSNMTVPIEFKHLIRQIVESYGIKTRLRIDTMSLSRAMETTHWITKRNMAIRNRLLALKAKNTKVQALKMVLIMWTLLSMNLTGRIKTVKIMAVGLMETMIKSKFADWTGDEDIRLWILLVGYTCAAENTETCEWFYQQCCEVGGLLSPLTTFLVKEQSIAETLEKFQCRFLYHAPVQEQRMQDLVRKLDAPP